jgi:hypothetical protein
MKPIILFRCDRESEEEYKIAEQYFSVVDYRTACLGADLVIGRYSVLPYYSELVKDLTPTPLVNSHKQHRWIADFQYYEILRDYTPETWDDTNIYLSTHPGPFVVKGKTNSRKYDWNKAMFAKTRRDAMNVAGCLKSDMFIGCQDIIYRKYVPLRKFEEGLNGLPFTNEWRFFYYKTHRLSYGYYWSSASEETILAAQISDKGLKLADDLSVIVSKHVNFYVMDIAETESGDWILIELNDGQMSGLSENNPHTLYSNLREAIGLE